MKELKSYIYKLTFDNNNLCYIGKSRVPEMRLKSHLYKLSSNTHPNDRLQKDYNNNKCKKPRMEILQEVDLSKIDMVEDFYIKKYCNECYNIANNRKSFHNINISNNDLSYIVSTYGSLESALRILVKNGEYEQLIINMVEFDW